MKLPRYIVWKKMGNTSVDIGRFYWRSLAETFMYAQKEHSKLMQFQITEIGEKPVWR